MCVLSSSQVLVVMICTPHRGSSLICAHLQCPYMQGTFYSTMSSPFHRTSSFPHSSSISCSSPLYFFHNFEGSTNTAYSAKKEMNSTEESCVFTSISICKRIHHRFVNDPDVRASQLEHGRHEKVSLKMEELAQKDVGII